MKDLIEQAEEELRHAPTTLGVQRVNKSAACSLLSIAKDFKRLVTHCIGDAPATPPAPTTATRPAPRIRTRPAE